MELSRALFVAFLCLAAVSSVQSASAKAGLEARRRYHCPLCDSSVFSYCSDKLLHDACCCLSPHEQALPLECQLADCSFLHSNSCDEHQLITQCCCNRVK